MWVAFLPCLLFQHHSLHGYVDSQKAQAPSDSLYQYFGCDHYGEKEQSDMNRIKWSNHTLGRNSPTCHTVCPRRRRAIDIYLILYCGLSWWLCVGDPLADGQTLHVSATCTCIFRAGVMGSQSRRRCIGKDGLEYIHWIFASRSLVGTKYMHTCM